MPTTDNRLNTLVWAVALVLGGVLLLLFNFDVFVRFEPIIQYVVAALLVATGVTFFGAYYLPEGQLWWRLIPAWTLLALAGMVYLSIRHLSGQISAAILFVGLALAFAHIYVLDRAERWWAVIPGGFMLVLAGVLALSSRTQQPDTLGSALFVGMGLIFFLLYVLGGRRQWWAIIPGTVLVVFGFFVFSSENRGQSTLLRWWPILLVLVGLALGWWAFRQRSQEKLSVNTAPDMSSRAMSRQRQRETDQEQPRGRLGDYSGPAPGSSVEVLPDPEEADSD